MLNTCARIMLTGATSGIGRQLFQQLQPMAKEIIIVGRNQQILQQLQSEHKNTKAYPCDLSDQHSVYELTNTIKYQHPKLNILINNAGVQYTPSFIDPDFNFDSMAKEINLNLLAPAWISYLLLPSLMQQPKAMIINISSGLAFAPKKQSAMYCASKAGLHSLTQSLRYQLQNTSVKSVEVLLPLVDTPMTVGRGKNKLSAADAAAQIISGIRKDKNEIYVGAAKYLPWLMRISPGLVKQILKRS